MASSLRLSNGGYSGVGCRSVDYAMDIAQRIISGNIAPSDWGNADFRLQASSISATTWALIQVRMYQAFGSGAGRLAISSTKVDDTAY